MLKRILFIVLATSVNIIFAQDTDVSSVPPLRDQISLNGQWDFIPGNVDTSNPANKITMTVPEFWDGKPYNNYGSVFMPPENKCLYDSAIYERTVSVPADWAGKRIMLEFDGVNQTADVYVNGIFVDRHVGGSIHFEMDITDFVSPGADFHLAVNVNGVNDGKRLEVIDERGYPTWPVSAFGHLCNFGITFDTWLRAYGNVYVDDTYIKTSYRNNKIETEYTIINTTKVPKTVVIQSYAINAKTNVIEKQITSGSFTIPASDTMLVNANAAWDKPTLWFPYPEEDPQLYHLKTAVIENSMDTLDIEMRRFGFREIWIDGINFMLNGMRINLYGNSEAAHWEMRKASKSSPQKWANTVDRYLATNVRYIRFHQGPPDPYMLDICDEKGMLVMSESAIYAREYSIHLDRELYVENSKKWLDQWVRDTRNHASVIMWSVENEMAMSFHGSWSVAHRKQWVDKVREVDNTRPIITAGDNDSGNSADTWNIHYPEGYENQWNESIYMPIQNPAKPNGIGEFLTHYGDNKESNWLWQGKVVRGLRYKSWSDIRPYRLDWLYWGDYFPTMKETTRQNLINSFAFVALFDKEYDELGIAPLKDNVYPELDEGSVAHRTLVLYNDEFSQTDITIKAEIEINGEIRASGIKTLSLKLGEHVDIPYAFQVPLVDDVKTMFLHLSTYKNDVEKFSESLAFKVTEKKYADSTSPHIIFEHKTPPMEDPKDDMQVSVKKINGRFRIITEGTLSKADKTLFIHSVNGMRVYANMFSDSYHDVSIVLPDGVHIISVNTAEQSISMKVAL